MTTADSDPDTDPFGLTTKQRTARRAWVMRWRWFLSGSAIIDMAGLFSSYLIRPRSATSTASAANSVVVALDDQHPWLWPTLFGAGLIGLVAALLVARWLTGAHVVAFSVLVFYTVAAGVTAHLSHGGWAAATLAGGSAFGQFMIAQLYARTVRVDAPSPRGAR